MQNRSVSAPALETGSSFSGLLQKVEGPLCWHRSEVGDRAQCQKSIRNGDFIRLSDGVLLNSMDPRGVSGRGWARPFLPLCL